MKHIKSIVEIAFVLSLMLGVGYSAFTAFSFLAFPSSASAAATSTATTLVNLTVDAGITISGTTTVTMAPHIGVASNSSIGTSQWVVSTNNSTGYSLYVNATTSPALVSGANSFADYTTSNSTWAVPAGQYQFGFGAYGPDVVSGLQGDNNCGSAGNPSATLKYRGFTTSNYQIATKATTTPVLGTITNVCFAAGQNGVYAPSGSYQATIIGTAATI